MWTYSQWTGVTPILGNLPTKKMFFDNTRILSKSPVLEALSMEFKNVFKILNVTLI